MIFAVPEDELRYIVSSNAVTDALGTIVKQSGPVAALIAKISKKRQRDAELLLSLHLPELVC